MEAIWSELVHSRPSEKEVGIQGYLAGNKEFVELAAPIDEAVPERAHYYKHQEFVTRYLQTYSELILFHAAGSGKTGTIISVAESFRLASRMNPIDGYLAGRRTGITGAIIVTKNKVLVQKYYNDYKNKHTFGSDLPENFYLVMTHVTFYLEHRNDTEEQLRTLLSNKFIALDEVQFIIHRSMKLKEEVIEEELVGDEIYTWFLYLRQFMINSVVVPATASLVNTNIGESSRIYNMLPSAIDNPLPEKDGDLRKLLNSKEGLQPYLNGKVSYITQPDRYVIKKQMGVPVRTLRGETGPEAEDSVYVVPLEMDNYQASKYQVFLLEEGKKKDAKHPGVAPRPLDAFRTAERKASNIVENDTGHRTLEEIAIKIAFVVKLLETHKGCIYVYCPRLQAGTNDIAEAVSSALGYRQFDPSRFNWEKERRFALITSKEESKIGETLRIQQDIRNIDGEYIRVVIVSPKGEVGIDLYYCLATVFVEGNWTPGRSSQAEDRAYRATSHLALALRAGEKVESEIYRLVICFSDEDTLKMLDWSDKKVSQLKPKERAEFLKYKYGTVDVDSYLEEQNRLDDAKPLIREYIRNSIEFIIQEARNRSLKLKPVDPKPKTVDDTNYRILYNRPALEALRGRLVSKMEKELAVDLDEFISEGTPPLLVHRAVKESINDNLFDHFGQAKQIHRVDNIGFLQNANEEPNYNTINNRGLAFDHSLELNRMIQIKPERFNDESLPMASRVAIIEEILLGGPSNPYYKQLMNRYGGKTIYEFKRPRGKLEVADAILNTGLNYDKRTGQIEARKKIGRRKKPDTPIDVCEFGPNSEVVDDHTVVVHTLGLFTNLSGRHGRLAQYIKVESIRYIEGSKFVTAAVGTPEELVYRFLIQKQIEKRINGYITSLPPKRNRLFLYYFEGEPLINDKPEYLFVRLNHEAEPEEEGCMMLKLSSKKGNNKGLRQGSVANNARLRTDIATYLELPFPPEVKRVQLQLPEDDGDIVLKNKELAVYNEFQTKWKLPPKQQLRLKALIRGHIEIIGTKDDFIYQSILKYLTGNERMPIIEAPYYHELKGEPRNEAWLKLWQCSMIVATFKPDYIKLLNEEYYLDPTTYFDRITRLASWDKAPSEVHLVDRIIEFLEHSIPKPLSL